MIPRGGSGIEFGGGQRLVGFIYKRFVGALVDVSHDKAQMHCQSFRIYSKASLSVIRNATKRIPLTNTDQWQA
jgi:hypothetical protein